MNPSNRFSFVFVTTIWCSALAAAMFTFASFGWFALYAGDQVPLPVFSRLVTYSTLGGLAGVVFGAVAGPISFLLKDVDRDKLRSKIVGSAMVYGIVLVTTFVAGMTCFLPVHQPVASNLNLVIFFCAPLLAVGAWLWSLRWRPEVDVPHLTQSTATLVVLLPLLGWLLIWQGLQYQFALPKPVGAWFAIPLLSFWAAGLLLAEAFLLRFLQLMGWKAWFRTPALAILVLVFLGGFALDRSRSSGGSSDRPSILVIVFDGLGQADFKAALSGEDFPNLKKLIASGMEFESARASGSHCLSSHTSLLSGALPSSHGVSGGLMRLEPSGNTAYLGQLLAKDGYTTGAFLSSVWLSPAYAPGKGFDRYYWSRLTPAHYWDPVRGLRYLFSGSGFPSQLVLDEARQWITSSGDKDLFALLNLRGAYPVFELSNFEREQVQARLGLVGEDWERVGSYVNSLGPGYLLGYELGVDSMRTEDRDHLRIVHRWAARDMLRRVEEFLGVLEDGGHLEEMVVVLTADHALSFGEGGHVGHYFTLHEQVLNVPLVIAGPGIPSGTKVSGVREQRHLAPTLLRLAGLNVPESMQDVSLLNPVSQEAEPSVESALVAELGQFVAIHRDAKAQGLEEDLLEKLEQLTQAQRAVLMDGRWKLIVFQDGTKRLYDLESDPAEALDRSGEPELQDLLARFDEVLAGLPPMESLRDTRSSSGPGSGTRSAGP